MPGGLAFPYEPDPAKRDQVQQDCIDAAKVNIAAYPVRTPEADGNLTGALQAIYVLTVDDDAASPAIVEVDGGEHHQWIDDRARGVRLLLACLEDDQQRTRAAVDAILAAGGDAARAAWWDIIEGHVGRWYNKKADAGGIRVSVFATGLRSLITRLVPADDQTAVTLAFVATMAGIQAGTARTVVPVETDELRADLYVAALVGRWLVGQPPLSVGDTRRELGQVLDYLRRSDLRLDGEPPLSDSDTDRAISVLADVLGHEFAASLPRTPHQRLAREEELLRAASLQPPPGIEVFHVLHDVIEDRRDDNMVATRRGSTRDRPASPKPATTESLEADAARELTAKDRVERERQRRRAAAAQRRRRGKK